MDLRKIISQLEILWQEKEFLRAATDQELDDLITASIGVKSRASAIRDKRDESEED